MSYIRPIDRLLLFLINNYNFLWNEYDFKFIDSYKGPNGAAGILLSAKDLWIGCTTEKEDTPELFFSNRSFSKTFFTSERFHINEIQHFLIPSMDFLKRNSEKEDVSFVKDNLEKIFELFDSQNYNETRKKLAVERKRAFEEFEKQNPSWKTIKL